MPPLLVLRPGERRSIRTEHAEIMVCSCLRQHDGTEADVFDIRVFPGDGTAIETTMMGDNTIIIRVVEKRKTARRPGKENDGDAH